MLKPYPYVAGTIQADIVDAEPVGCASDNGILCHIDGFGKNLSYLGEIRGFEIHHGSIITS